MRISFVAAVALFLSACSPEPQQDAPKEERQAASLYRSDIAPLLTSRCATCHMTGQEAGNMALVPDQAIASLVGVKAVGAPALTRITPGKPDESYLIMKLENTHTEHGGTGGQMPFGAPPLSKDDITKIRKWISEGAKE